MSWVVEATYDGGPVLKGREDERWEFNEGDGQDLERAAQRFQSEAQPERYLLADIVEDLATEGGIRYECSETCRTFVVYELVEAGVV